MIGHLSSANPWIVIGSGVPNYPYVGHSTNPMQGMVRIFNNRMEVWTGNEWTLFYGEMITIDLSARAKAALDWAERRMLEEQRLERLAQQHPAVADAVAAVAAAQEQLNIVAILTEEDKK